MRTNLVQQFTRFSGVGFVTAIGHYGLLIALVKGAGVNPVTASAAGALLGAVINYSLNYHFTFGSNKRHRDAILKFGVVATIGLLLNTFFMWAGIAILGMHFMLSQILATGLVIIWSFIGDRKSVV